MKTAVKIKLEIPDQGEDQFYCQLSVPLLYWQRPLRVLDFQQFTAVWKRLEKTMDYYLGFLLLVFFAAGTVSAMIAINYWLGPRTHSRIHDMPFECGIEPKAIKQGRFAVKFFVVALLFILFDIELIFLFSWASIYRELGLFGFVEMSIFLLVVISGLFYSVKKGVLRWE